MLKYAVTRLQNMQCAALRPHHHYVVLWLSPSCTWLAWLDRRLAMCSRSSSGHCPCTWFELTLCVVLLIFMRQCLSLAVVLAGDSRQVVSSEILLPQQHAPLRWHVLFSVVCFVMCVDVLSLSQQQQPRVLLQQQQHDSHAATVCHSLPQGFRTLVTVAATLGVASPPSRLVNSAIALQPPWIAA